MPRHLDPQLEGRILNTADRLWQRGGEKALTMRAVARAAGTTTPTLYQRFRNRDHILRALVRRSQQRLVEEIRPCRSLQEVFHCVFLHGRRNPHDYELLSSDLIARLKEPRPSLQLVLQKAAEWFGGRPQDHYPLIVALWALLQGAFVLTRMLQREEERVLESSLAASADLLIHHRQTLQQLA
jgi:AcrR family transcriptional regulator